MIIRFTQSPVYLLGNSLTLVDSKKGWQQSQERKINENDFVVVNAHIEIAINKPNRKHKQRREKK